MINGRINSHQDHHVQDLVNTWLSRLRQEGEFTAKHCSQSFRGEVHTTIIGSLCNCCIVDIWLVLVITVIPSLYILLWRILYILYLIELAIDYWRSWLNIFRQMFLWDTWLLYLLELDSFTYTLEERAKPS
jgi:hypothetical protein